MDTDNVMMAAKENFVDATLKKFCSRRCLNVSLVLLSFIALSLIYLLYAMNRNLYRNDYSYAEPLMRYKADQPSPNVSDEIGDFIAFNHNTHGFHPVNDKGIYSFWNVCIEAQYPATRRSIEFLGHKLFFNETQKIVVYNSFFRNGMQKVYTSGSHNSAWNHWDVEFSRSRIPKSHTFRTNTVYFIAPTCPSNFHHFWIDEFVPLYAVVKQANKLKPDAGNQILYRRPSGLLDAETQACFNTTMFEPVIATLYTDPFHDVFFRMKPNTCFSSGVFGTTPLGLVKPREVVEHVLRTMNVTRLRKQSGYVTFIQRSSNRFILNVDELVAVAESLGYRRVRVVRLETLDVRTQVKLAARSSVMVGVQGAGLQWAVFMPPDSTLIEIAWPQRHWGFYFESYVTQYDIRHVELVASFVQQNWTSYETLVRNGRPVSVEERLQLLQQPPKSGSVDNIWKSADAWVNKEDFLNTLGSLETQPHVAVQ